MIDASADHVAESNVGPLAHFGVRSVKQKGRMLASTPTPTPE
jgi:hypothetical protein